MDILVIIITPIVVLLGYSGFQLYTSRWEREERRVDRFQVLLVIIVALDIPCVFSPFLVPLWNAIGAHGMYERVVVILSGVVPLVAGGLVALRKGPIRIAMPVACLLLVLCASFLYWLNFIWMY
jgi:hypothetical protein